MHAYDFEAVYYDLECYCVECLPDGVTAESDGVDPIFAASELYNVPVCEKCGAEHTYMNLLLEDEGVVDDT